jgi:four helix bundle protein
MITKGNPVVDKSIEFSLLIIAYCEELNKENKRVVANQLLRSGTSIGANICEAQNAESKADFVHKVKIAAKELEETKYWLTLCKESSLYTFDEKLEKSIIELGLIVYKILSSSKRN